MKNASFKTSTKKITQIRKPENHRTKTFMPEAMRQGIIMYCPPEKITYFTTHWQAQNLIRAHLLKSV